MHILKIRKKMLIKIQKIKLKEKLQAKLESNKNRQIINIYLYYDANCQSIFKVRFLSISIFKINNVKINFIIDIHIFFASFNLPIGFLSFPCGTRNPFTFINLK